MGIGVPYVITNNIAYMYLSDTFEMFPESPWDRKIPVIPWMIFPYAGLYFYYPGILAVCPNTDRGRMELLSTMQMMICATMFCVIIFLTMPAEIDMRDAIDWSHEPGPTLDEVSYFESKSSPSTPKGALLCTPTCTLFCRAVP